MMTSPNPFDQLAQQINGLEELLRQSMQQRQVATVEPVEEPIDKSEAAAYLRLSVSALSQNLHKIPHHKRHGKVYFFKSELKAYLLAGISLGQIQKA